MTDLEHRRNLISGLLDNELNPDELAEANQLLIRDQAFRDEYELMRRSLLPLDELSVIEPDEAALEKFWRLPYGRLVRNAGLVLLLGGYLSLLGFGVLQFMQDEEEWLFGKLAFAAIIAGGLILLGIVVIERFISYQSDPYKEIKK